MITGFPISVGNNASGVFSVGPMPAGSLVELIRLCYTCTAAGTRFGCCMFPSRPRVLADFAPADIVFLSCSMSGAAAGSQYTTTLPVWRRVSSVSPYCGFLVDNIGVGFAITGSVFFSVRPPRGL